MKIKIRICPLRLCRPRTNSLLSCHFKTVLNRTKQCHKERNAEIHYKSVEDGDNYKLLSGRSCNDGSVVSIVVAPPAAIGARLPNQRTSNGAASKGQNLTADVGEQGNCS